MADNKKMAANKKADTNNNSSNADGSNDVRIDGKYPPLNLGILFPACAPAMVKSYEPFSIVLACHMDPVDDDSFRVYRETKYTDQYGKQQMMPMAGMVHANEDARQFSFNQLMFYNPSFEEKVKGQWLMEFVLESSIHGELSRLIMSIQVD